MNPDGTGRRAQWMLSLALVLALVLVFGRSVGFSFVVWDDPGNVARNPYLAPPSLRSLGHFWSHGSDNYYVPLSYTVWWGIALVSRALCGALEPALFHGANVVLHALTVLLVFRWLRELVSDWRAACAGALLFALHPLHIESVCWVTELRGLLCALPGFGALLLVLRGRRWSAALLFLLALLAKPTAVSFAALLLVQELVWRRRPWREVLALHGSWFVLAAGAVAATSWQAAGEEVHWVMPLLERPLVSLDALGFYLAKFAWPLGLCAEYGRSSRLVLESGSVWPGACLFALALAAALVWPERRRALGALLFFVVALLPVLGLVPFGYQEKSTVADRYAYVALAGAALGLALLVTRFGRPAFAGALALALAWGALSFVQTAHWRDTTALFGRVLEVNPRSITAHTNLGVVAIESHDLEGARAHFARALELDPEQRAALSNLGSVECELGRYEEGLAHLREAVARNPRSISTRKNLVAGLVRAGRQEEAQAAARELEALTPR